MAAAIQGGVSLKKTPAPAPSKPPVVEKKPGGQGWQCVFLFCVKFCESADKMGAGSFAEMAAAIAKQRAERARAAPPAQRDSARQLDQQIFLIRTSLRDE